MAHVEAHVARPGHPHDGVEVGPIVVDEATGGVDEGGELQDVFLKEPHGIGIGEHQPRRVGAAGGPQGLQIHQPLGVGGMFWTVKPAMAAEAGLVPWAESGTRITVRPVSPRLWW